MRGSIETINESALKRNWKMAFLILAVYGLIAVRLIGFPEIPGGLNQDGAMGQWMQERLPNTLQTVMGPLCRRTLKRGGMDK